MNVIICDDYQLIVKSLIRDIQHIDAKAECRGFTDATEVLGGMPRFYRRDRSAGIHPVEPC